MITLNQAKHELGIDLPDSGDDAELTRNVAQIITRIRQQTSRGIAWVCDRVDSVNSKARLRVIAHGFRTGQVVKIVGSGNNSIDAVHTITVINQNLIELSVNGTIEETEFTLHPRTTIDIVPRSSTRIWLPESVTPCFEIIEILDNDKDNDWIALSGTDWFASNVKGEKAVEVTRKVGTFPVPVNTPRGQWNLRKVGTTETVRLSVYAGADIPPSDMAMAALSLVCDLFERAGRGKDESSFSFEDVRRQAMSGEERLSHVLSPTSVINSWVAR
jgi:hypothetical protein